MNKNTEFEFNIDALTPDTLPMKRLAEYLKALSAVMGETNSVCFRQVKKGSALLVQDVIGPESLQRVTARIEAVKRHDAPADALRAFHEVNKLLKQDRATGYLRSINGLTAANSELFFPGREVPDQLNVTVMQEEGTLDGVLIQIGGKGKRVPVHIQYGNRHDDVYKCSCDRELATELAPLLFKEVRVNGIGDWQRKQDSQWQCERFLIESFVPLPKAGLAETLKDLHAVIGEDITSLGNPSEFFKDLRKD